MCVIATLYIVFAIAFKDIYALYGKQPSVIIVLNIIPFNPDILGVNVFCFSSPSLFAIR